MRRRSFLKSLTLIGAACMAHPVLTRLGQCVGVVPKPADCRITENGGWRMLMGQPDMFFLVFTIEAPDGTLFADHMAVGLNELRMNGVDVPTPKRLHDHPLVIDILNTQAHPTVRKLLDSKWQDTLASIEHGLAGHYTDIGVV